jgi:hypothetical protein
MSEREFSIEQFYEAQKSRLIETIETEVPEDLQEEVVAHLPALCEEVVRALARRDPDEANKLGTEIRRKVEIAMATWDERDRKVLLDHLRRLPGDVMDQRPENN